MAKRRILSWFCLWISCISQKLWLAELWLLLEICVGLGWEQLGVKGENHFSHYSLNLSQGRNVPTFFFFLFSKPHISAKIVKWQRWVKGRKISHCGSTRENCWEQCAGSVIPSCLYFNFLDCHRILVLCSSTLVNWVFFFSGLVILSSKMASSVSRLLNSDLLKKAVINVCLWNPGWLCRRSPGIQSIWQRSAPGFLFCAGENSGVFISSSLKEETLQTWWQNPTFQAAAPAND